MNAVTKTALLWVLFVALGVGIFAAIPGHQPIGVTFPVGFVLGMLALIIGLSDA